jgi:Protein of unknown function (DUF2806)
MPLIDLNLGALAEPANTLIVKLSEAAGGLFLPYQIVRTAKAKAEAAITKANAEIAVSDLQKRAHNRALAEQVRHQENIESIASRAIHHLTENTDADKMENDWVVNFLDKARNISNDEMQELWAKILAGEANMPGTFSKRTVNFIADVDKDDADRFASLCRFGWIINGNFNLLIFDYTEKIYTENGINFEALQHLEDIGLIKFIQMNAFAEVDLPANISVHYHGTSLPLNPLKDELPTGQVLITNVGKELARICDSNPVDGFIQYVLNHWHEHIIPIPPSPPKNA